MSRTVCHGFMCILNIYKQIIIFTSRIFKNTSLGNHHQNKIFNNFKIFLQKFLISISYFRDNCSPRNPTLNHSVSQYRNTHIRAFELLVSNSFLNFQLRLLMALRILSIVQKLSFDFVQAYLKLLRIDFFRYLQVTIQNV